MRSACAFCITLLDANGVKNRWGLVAVAAKSLTFLFPFYFLIVFQYSAFLFFLKSFFSNFSFLASALFVHAFAAGLFQRFERLDRIAALHHDVRIGVTRRAFQHVDAFSRQRVQYGRVDAGYLFDFLGGG